MSYFHLSGSNVVCSPTHVCVVWAGAHVSWVSDSGTADPLCKGAFLISDTRYIAVSRPTWQVFPVCLSCPIVLVI